MKKHLFLSVLGCIAFVFLSFVSVNATSDILEISDISVIDKSSTTDATVSSFTGDHADTNIRFHNVDDFVTLKISLKNPSSEPYKILNTIMEGTSPNINYEYSDPSGTILGANAVFDFTFKATYTNAISTVFERDQSVPVSFKFTLEGLNSNSEIEDEVVIVPNTGANTQEQTVASSNTEISTPKQIVNSPSTRVDTPKQVVVSPNTGANTLKRTFATEFPMIFIILGALSGLSALILFSKKHKKLGSISVIAAFVFVGLIPVTASALSIVNTNITLNTDFELRDKVVVAYTDKNNNRQQVLLDYGESLDEVENYDDKEGFTFKWRTNEGADFDPSAPVTDDLELVPTYIPNTYKIVLNSGDGVGDDIAIDATYDTAVKLPANTFVYEREYDWQEMLYFGGWNTAEDYSGKHFSNEAEVKNLTSENGGTVTLYAEWVYENYYLYFSIGDGPYRAGTNMDSIEFRYGDTITLPEASFYGTEGFKFTHWNTEWDGSGTSFEDGATIDHLPVQKNDYYIYLYAQFEVAESTLKTGSEINTVLKTLSGIDANLSFRPWFYDYYEKPSLSLFTEKYDISASGEPVWVFRENDVVYWWSEANPKMNVNSSHMFEGTKFTEINLEYMIMEDVEDLSYMFAGSSIVNAPYVISYLDSAKSTYAMFEGCQSLESVQIYSAPYLENAGSMFKNSSISSASIYSLINENTTNISSMFENTPNLTGVDTTSWDTTNVTDMSYLFKDSGITDFDFHRGGTWNTSSVTDMSGMFENTKAEILDLSPFDTSSVTSMDRMFWEEEGDAHIFGIYVDDSFVVSSVDESDGQTMFNNNAILKGAFGTAYSAEHRNKDYAHIDFQSNPGYFTDVADKPVCKVFFHMTNTSSDEQNTMPYGFYPGDVDVKLPANQYSRPNYVFLGWEKREYYSSPTLIPDEGMLHTYASEGSSIHLYGKWRPLDFEEVLPDTNLTTVNVNGNEYYKMQDMTPEICALVGKPEYDNPSDAKNAQAPSIQMVDIRDNKLYWVAKLKDDKCWMTQNLDYDLNENTPLTPEDSDVKQNWTPPTTFTRQNGKFDYVVTTHEAAQSYDLGDIYWDNSDRPYMYNQITECNLLDIDSCTDGKFAHTPFPSNGTHGHIGNFYNWPAAIAADSYGEYHQSYYNDHESGAVIPDTSICPKGWRLPTAKYHINNSTAVGTDEFANGFDWYHSNYTYNDNGRDRYVVNEPSYLVAADLIYMAPVYSINTPKIDGGARIRYWSNIPYNGRTGYENAWALHVIPQLYAISGLDNWGETNAEHGVPVRCVAR